MRLRLFWQLLATFAVLIVFGVGGTVALILLRFTQIAAEARPSAVADYEHLWISRLAEYYRAHGDSWEGVERWVDSSHSDVGWTFGPAGGFALYDRDGRLIASDGKIPDGTSLEQPFGGDGRPIDVDGVRVGTLVITPSEWGQGSPWHFRDGMSAETPLSPGGAGPLLAPSPAEFRSGFERRVGRSFMLVALSIGSMTLGLAVIMSRRISAPLAGLTRAASQVAAGNLQVAVPTSSVQEVDSLARAFDRMAANLRREDQLRRNMTADIAHELRTPLTIIKGKLEGILDGVYPATPDHIAPVLEEATLLERLVEDLRLLSLAEARRLPLHPEEVAVSDLLEDVRRSFTREAAAQEVTLTVETPPSLPPVIVDPQRMQQVLGNLVTNSLRHTPHGGRIELRAALLGGGVTITVRDSGRGIAPDELPYIFDRFWRGDRARSRHGSGAGLGLAISRQLVEAQGGQIEATSVPGRGTTMSITLPRAGMSPG